MIIVLRGVPGSGKTTYARERYANDSIVSADDFFVKDGKYEFDPKLLPKAHASCLHRFVRLVTDADHDRHIIVDNTNLTIAEIAPYVAVGEAWGQVVQIITLKTDPLIAARRNVHGVSEVSVEQMYRRMNAETPRFPVWWKHDEIYPYARAHVTSVSER